MNVFIQLAESGLLPDFLLRFGIRQLCRQRVRHENQGSLMGQRDTMRIFLEQLRKSPIAVSPELPKEQHCEVPVEFFQQVLGRRLKYSCCFYPTGEETLNEAEEEMLELTCQRAGVKGGMRILELGCGWGSLSLWLAQKYPGIEITAVSNSPNPSDILSKNNVKPRGSVAYRLSLLT